MSTPTPTDRFLRGWDAAAPRAGVALVHGLAEHSGRYEYVGRALADAGCSVRAVDIHGHGRSPGWPGTGPVARRGTRARRAGLEAPAGRGPGGPRFPLATPSGPRFPPTSVPPFQPKTDGS